MASDENAEETSRTITMVVVAILVFLVPTTLHVMVAALGCGCCSCFGEGDGSEGHGNLSAGLAKHRRQILQARRRRKGRRNKSAGSNGKWKYAAVVAMWGVVAGLVSIIPEEVPPPDPWDVLGLPHGENNKRTIKKAYRKLSLRYHPDKQSKRTNRQKAGADTEAAAKFIQVNEAYRTLSDPVAMENYRKYGNPDGPRWRREMPLPSFLDSGSSDPTTLLLIYGIGIIGLPGCCLWQAKRCRQGGKRGSEDPSLVRDRDWIKKIIFAGSVVDNNQDHPTVSYIDSSTWGWLLAAGGGIGALEVLARCPGVAEATRLAASQYGGESSVLSKYFDQDLLKLCGLEPQAGETYIPAGKTQQPKRKLPRSLALILLLVHTRRLTGGNNDVIHNLLGTPLDKHVDKTEHSEQKTSSTDVDERSSDKSVGESDKSVGSAPTSGSQHPSKEQLATVDSALLEPLLQVCYPRLQIMLECIVRSIVSGRRHGNAGLKTEWLKSVSYIMNRLAQGLPVRGFEGHSIRLDRSRTKGSSNNSEGNQKADFEALQRELLTHEKKGVSQRRTRVPKYTLAAVSVGVIEKLNPFEAAEQAELRKARGESGEIKMERILKTIRVGDQLTIKVGLNRHEADHEAGDKGFGNVAMPDEKQVGEEKAIADDTDRKETKHHALAGQGLLDVPSFLAQKGRWPSQTSMNSDEDSRDEFDLDDDVAIEDRWMVTVEVQRKLATVLFCADPVAWTKTIKVPMPLNPEKGLELVVRATPLAWAGCGKERSILVDVLAQTKEDNDEYEGENI